MSQIERILPSGVWLLYLASIPLLFLPETEAARTAVEVKRFSAPEARQGVAVDDRYVYVVTNQAVAKYDEATHQRLKYWEATAEVPLVHLDSGVIDRDRLYAAHSNYPELPMTSSVEIWDVESLDHVDSHSFGIGDGSCTWVNRHNGSWWVCFAHYDKRGGYPDKDVSWTTVVQYDDRWRRLGAWVFPPEVVQRFTPYSCSGGSWGPDGLLYCTGHDRPEIYAMRLPQSGSVLELVEIIQVRMAGQGIAWDRSDPGVLYGIVKKERVVVVNRMSGIGEARSAEVK